MSYTRGKYRKIDFLKIFSESTQIIKIVFAELKMIIQLINEIIILIFTYIFIDLYKLQILKIFFLIL